MTSYLVSAAKTTDGVLLRLSFNKDMPAENDRLVVDAVAALEELGDELGGGTVYLNGAASLPVAVAVGHYVVHRFREVCVFDPKMQAYIVTVSHGGRQVGHVVPKDDVVEAASQTRE